MIIDMDMDHPPKSGILPQYAHLRGLAENMPVIRQLIGLSEYGQFPTNTPIGRALQRLVKGASKDAMR